MANEATPSRNAFVAIKRRLADGVCLIRAGAYAGDDATEDLGWKQFIDALMEQTAAIDAVLARSNEGRIS
jgi:hypothetical protein